MKRTLLLAFLLFPWISNASPIFDNQGREYELIWEDLGRIEDAYSVFTDGYSNELTSLRAKLRLTLLFNAEAGYLRNFPLTHKFGILIDKTSLEVVGFVSYDPSYNEVLELRHLIVGHNHRRQGLGKQLLYAVLNRTKPRPDKISIVLRKDNRLGFSFLSGIDMDGSISVTDTIDFNPKFYTRLVLSTSMEDCGPMIIMDEI